MGKIYKSGIWSINTNSSQINLINGTASEIEQVIVLEPRVMDLLIHFLENPGRTITRDELIDEVWKGTNVSESAINWTIAQLRKSLQDNQSPRQYIQTLSKKGYQWLKEVVVTEVQFEEPDAVTSLNNAQLQSVQPLRSTLKIWLSFSLLLFILTLTIIHFFNSSDDSSMELKGQSRPVTSLKGNESQPVFSRNGLWLAFTHQNSANKTVLMIKALNEDIEFITFDDANKQDEQTQKSIRSLPEKILTEQADRIVSPAWDPLSKSLAFIKLDNGKCEVVLISLNSSMDVTETKTLTECHPSGHSKLDWGADSKTLYFTDSLENKPYQVFSYNIEENARTAVGVADVVQSGSHLVRVSPTKSEAIIVKDIESRESEFYLMNLQSGEQELLLNRKGIYYDIDWSPDGQGFYLNFGQQNLYYFDIQSKEVSLLLSTVGNMIYGLVKSPIEETYVYASSSNNSSRIEIIDLKNQVNADINLSEIKTISIDSSSSEYHPVLNKNGDVMYFISERSGLPQIWKRSASGVEQQFSNLIDYASFGSIRLSEDGNKLIGESDTAVRSINFNKEVSWVHNKKGVKSKNPIFFNHDNEIIFAQLIDDHWQLVKVPFSSEVASPEILTTEGGYYSLISNDDELYYAKRAECGIYSYQFSTKTHQLLSSKVCLSSNSFYKVGEDVYFEFLKGDIAGIYKWHQDTDSMDLVLNRNLNPGYGFSISEDGRYLAVQLRNEINSDIYSIKVE